MRYKKNDVTNCDARLLSNDADCKNCGQSRDIEIETRLFKRVARIQKTCLIVRHSRQSNSRNFLNAIV